MKRQIELHKNQVDYILKQDGRTKRIWLTVKCDGTFLVSAPKRLSVAKIEEFIRKKSLWVVGKIEYYRKNPGRIVHIKEHDFQLYKTAALRLARLRLAHFNSIYGFTYKKVSIRKQRSRWGSCSRSGNLSFNYQIALLPPHLSDYIIVHELCHLKEFNHSSRFWTLVEKTIPNHLSVRREFRHINLH